MKDTIMKHKWLILFVIISIICIIVIFVVTFILVEQFDTINNGPVNPMALPVPTFNVTIPEKDLFMQLHNDLRARHNSAPLRWSSQLEDSATRYAAFLAQQCDIWHSEANGYGENLAFYASYGKAERDDRADISPQAAITQACYDWYNEIGYYNFDNPGPQQRAMIGHFTAMVWADTQELGCAVAPCASLRGHVVVCHYRSPGNVVSSDSTQTRAIWQRNVQRPSS